MDFGSKSKYCPCGLVIVSLLLAATRLAYDSNDKWAVAAEEHADLGPLGRFEPAGADNLILKPVLSRDFKRSI